MPGKQHIIDNLVMNSVCTQRACVVKARLACHCCHSLLAGTAAFDASGIDQKSKGLGTMEVRRTSTRLRARLPQYYLVCYTPAFSGQLGTSSSPCRERALITFYVYIKPISLSSHECGALTGARRRPASFGERSRCRRRRRAQQTRRRRLGPLSPVAVAAVVVVVVVVVVDDATLERAVVRRPCRAIRLHVKGQRQAHTACSQSSLFTSPPHTFSTHLHTFPTRNCLTQLFQPNRAFYITPFYLHHPLLS